MEYLKGACDTSTGQLCDFYSSTPWVGPRMNRIPQPVPDYDKLPRDPDDYMPRAQLRKDFAAGKRILANPEEIKAFAERYIVKEEYVIQYAQYLQELEWAKDIRARARQADAADRKRKAFEDYEWQKLLEDGKLGKLPVAELKKYLVHYSLPLTGKKADKVRTIVMHLGSHIPMVFVHDDEDDEEFEARVEVILAETDSPEISEESELDDNETRKDPDSDVSNQTVEFQSVIDAEITQLRRVIRRRSANDYIFY